MKVSLLEFGENRHIKILHPPDGGFKAEPYPFLGHHAWMTDKPEVNPKVTVATPREESQRRIGSRNTVRDVGAGDMFHSV
jgi:hypothetical protein